MKKIILMLSVILISSLMLTGCGEKGPKDVAIEFVEAFTSADIKEAKSLSSDNLKRDFSKVQRVCNKESFLSLKKSLNDFQKTRDDALEKTMKSKEDAKEIKNITQVFKTKVQAILAEDGVKSKAWVKEYGSVNNIPKNLVDNYIKDYTENLMNASGEFLKAQSKILNIENDDITFEIMVHGMVYLVNDVKSYNIEKVSINTYLSEHPTKITESCINKGSNLGYIDSINFIESIEVAADKSKVRLELIDKDGASNKRTIVVEKIKGEWRVTNI